MTRHRGFPAKAYLVLGAVVAAAGFSACGGGGDSSGTGSTIVPPASQAPEITITPPANRAPRAVRSIPAQTLEEGGSTQSVGVAPFFSDPDGDPLTWSARSGDPGIVTAGMSGSTLTLTPVSAGTATVTVTASDGHAEAVQTFRVTVPEPNRDPVVVGAIPTQTIEEGGSTQGTAQENDIPGSIPGQPVVAFTDPPVNRNDLTEGSTAAFTLTRTGNTSSALTVRVSVSETGDMVAAGNLGERTVNFAPGSSTATLSVPTVDDGTQEADSVVSARIESNAALYRRGSVSAASVTVLDDDSSGSSSDLPVVQVFQTFSTVNSGALTEGSTAELTLTRTGDTASTLAVRVTVSETGAMVAAADKGERTVTFASGSPTASMTVPTVDDEVEEAGSSLSVEIVANDDLYIRGTRHLETIGILDNDESSGEAVWVASWSGTTLTEGGTGVTITLTNSNTQSSRLRPTLIIVHVGRDEGTAGAGDIVVTQGGSPMARHKTGSDNRHHNGGWEYLGVSGGSAQVKITAVTNDGAEPAETLAVWVDADNRDVSSRVLTIASSTDTGTQD